MRYIYVPSPSIRKWLGFIKVSMYWKKNKFFLTSRSQWLSPFILDSSGVRPHPPCFNRHRFVFIICAGTPYTGVRQYCLPLLSVLPHMVLPPSLFLCKIPKRGLGNAWTGFYLYRVCRALSFDIRAAGFYIDMLPVSSVHGLSRGSLNYCRRQW